jgi:prolyl-tRNA synthetase
VGMMGGSGAHEYMAPCAAGENDVALSDAGYAANLEIASANAQAVELPEGLPGPEPVETPGATTIEAVTGMLGVPAGALIKALPVVVEGRGPVLVLVRGDHRLNEIKLQNTLGAPARPAEAQEVRDLFGTEPGFIGPIGAQVDVLADEALRGLHGLVTGANELDTHLRGVEPGRDFEPEWVDVRRVEAGDRCPAGGEIRIEPAIEVANIFKLGTRYSEPLGARYLDEQGKEQPIVMGSYGIGPARIVAAAIEQFHDEQGIAWPRALAPFDVELITLGKEGEEARTVADRLYDELRAAGLQVLYDDREGSAGEKFADAELLGCPLRLTIGKRGLEAGQVDAQIRRGQEQRSLPLDGAVEATAELWATLP